MTCGLDAYAKKLVRRAEGIWINMGLSLEERKDFSTDDHTSILFRFHQISLAQAAILVASMSEAFRKANIYWKEDESGIVIHTEIPPLR